MGIQCLNHTSIMRFLVLVALCAVTMALPEGRRLRPEEHWRPAQGRDLSKYRPRAAMVDTETGQVSWEEQMVNINRVAAQMREPGSLSSHKDRNRPKAVCGEEGPPAKDRIVGGEEATPNQWPWQVALFVDDSWFCGGSILSENYILTAAHCITGANSYDVMAGSHNIRADNEPHRVEVTSYKGWTHPEWDHVHLQNDIALIELPEPLEFNDYIKPACLPESGDTADPGDLATVLGWGKTSDASTELSDVLRMVHDVPVMSNEDCHAVFGIIGDGHVCLDATGGRGSCNGDSGGPLVKKQGGLQEPGQVWTQHGIVSFGAGAGCESGKPNGFTRVSYYRDWIISETGGK